MMEIKLVDVTIHIDETLEEERRPQLVAKIREHEGVVSVGYHDEKPHLMMVEYNPDKTSSSQLLESVKGEGLHAELIGL
jgi:hypothetical protein